MRDYWLDGMLTGVLIGVVAVIVIQRNQSTSGQIVWLVAAAATLIVAQLVVAAYRLARSGVAADQDAAKPRRRRNPFLQELSDEWTGLTPADELSPQQESMNGSENERPLQPLLVVVKGNETTTSPVHPAQDPTP